MGAVGGLLGIAGGDSGTGFSTTNGTSGAQLKTAYDQNQAALGQQNSLLSALQGQGGLQNQSNVYNQFQGIASGQGPNPAQAMLNQSTGANVANQAALMAGQRGASANPALMARQAAMQGANIQQQAAGQGATMQANQSLGALGQAAGMANTMAGQQIGQTNANAASQQAEQSILQGANTANNQVQGQLAGQNMQGQQKLMGGLGNALGVATKLIPGAGLAGAAIGKAQGGMIQPQGPMSSLGKKLMMPMSEGGKVPAMVSPGEIYLPPQQAQAVAQGKANPMKVGERIPGQPKVKGDSYSNDTVRKDLDAGGVVVKRTEAKNPKDAAGFVRAVMSKKKRSKK